MTRPDIVAKQNPARPDLDAIRQRQENLGYYWEEVEQQLNEIPELLAYITELETENEELKEVALQSLAVDLERIEREKK